MRGGPLATTSRMEARTFPIASSDGAPTAMALSLCDLGDGGDASPTEQHSQPLNNQRGIGADLLAGDADAFGAKGKAVRTEEVLDAQIPMPVIVVLVRDMQGGIRLVGASQRQQNCGHLRCNPGSDACSSPTCSALCT